MFEISNGSPETLKKMYTAVRKRLSGKGPSVSVSSRKPMIVYRRSGRRTDSTSSGGGNCKYMYFRYMFRGALVL